MTNEEKRDLKIDNGITIKEWIDYNINKYGAKEFFDMVNDEWENIAPYIKESILNEINLKVKPEKIDTIEDFTLGTSMPMAAFPGIGAIMREPNPNKRQKSSSIFLTLEIRIPGANVIS